MECSTGVSHWTIDSEVKLSPLSSVGRATTLNFGSEISPW